MATPRVVFVIKYALTQGIQTCAVKAVDGESVTCAWGGGEVAFHGNDWTASPVTALARAMRMRDNEVWRLQSRADELQKIELSRRISRRSGSNA